MDTEIKDNKELEPKLKEKVKKNVLYGGILTIVMFFAGLSSAYIVMMSDAFWVKLRLPTAFWISTGIILVSSLTIFMALKAAKAGNKKGIKLYLVLTLVLGLAFTYFQYSGWKYMYEMGSNIISPTLNPAPYGEEFSLRYKGDEVSFDGNQFMIGGEVVSPNVERELTNFANSVYVSGFVNRSDIINAENIIVVHKPTGTHLELKDNQFYFGEEPISLDKKVDLVKFAYTVANKVGYFFMRGNYGESYTLMYNGKPVEFEKGALTIDGKPLDGNQINELKSNQNTAGTFVYLFSFLHWLHLLGGLIYVIYLLSKAYKGVYSENNHLQLKLGGIYWHFLDILWVYLFLFLHFIH